MTLKGRLSDVVIRIRSVRNLRIYYFLIITIVFAFSCIIFVEGEQQGMGTNSTADSLVSYHDGIQITYPANWTVVEGAGKYNLATFLAPSSNSSEIDPAAIAIYKQNLSLSFVPTNASESPLQRILKDYFSNPEIRQESASKDFNSSRETNNSLSNRSIAIDEEDLFILYSNAFIKYIYENFDIINIIPTNLSGSAAFQIDFKTDENIISHIWTMTNYDVYSMSLVANSNDYTHYLPELERMKDSFVIVPA